MNAMVNIQKLLKNHVIILETQSVVIFYWFYQKVWN